MALEVFQVIKNRRSARRLSSEKVSWDVLRRVLDAGSWAPSAHNAQPWRFIVVMDNGLKKKLAEAMAEDWDKDLKEDRLIFEDRKHLTEASIKQFTSPPVEIVVCLAMEGMDAYPDEKRQKIEHTMAVQSVSASIQNLLLAASAEGLGACWFCAPLFCKETIRKVLGVPKNIEPQALITIGYPAEKPEAPQRKPLSEVVFKNYWGCRE
jgi:coenzyme F420-0:L-glutamate ligase/coenzyme F420-1:gamma-L-glutamate ligase